MTSHNPWDRITDPIEQVRYMRNMIEHHQGFAWAAVMERGADMLIEAAELKKQIAAAIADVESGEDAWHAVAAVKELLECRQEPPKPPPAVSARRKPPKPPAATQDPPRRKPGSLFNA